MINQTTFDETADALVASGTRVTYGHLRDAFRERNRLPCDTAPATSHSDRDLQDPFASWKQRRRYRPHLAALDLDERTEKALARFLALARSGKPIDSHLPVDDEPAGPAQVECLACRIEEGIATAAAEHAALRADIASLALAFAILAGERTKGRKAGIVASTALHFWDQLMQAFAAEIRKRGPLTAEELLATVTKDTLHFAERNFERITPGVIADKLQVRNQYNKYIKPTADGRYELLKRGRATKRSVTENA